MFACSVALAAAVAEQSGSGARVPAVWGAGPRRLGGAEEHLADDVTEGRAWRGLGRGAVPLHQRLAEACQGAELVQLCGEQSWARELCALEQRLSRVLSSRQGSSDVPSR